MSKNIIVTGGSGRFGQILKKINTKHNIFYPNKNELNILDYKSIINYIQKTKARYIIHLQSGTRCIGFTI